MPAFSSLSAAERAALALPAQPERAGLTPAELAAAFASLHWPGWTLEAALADVVRNRIVCAVARRRRALARREQQRATVWRTVRAIGRDCKRAAAGDFDDADCEGADR